MLLSSFSYKTNGWELAEMNALQSTNLLVGKNASGKTRIIRAIQNVTNFMQMRNFVFGEADFKAKMSFVDPKMNDWKMFYSFEVSLGRVAEERLVVNGKTLIKRDSGKAVFWGDTINPPTEKLVVQVRRDREEYPDVEKLMEWAEGVIAISCSNINPFTANLGFMNIINPLPFSTLVDTLTKDDKKKVLESARRMGYEIIDMSTVKATSEMEFVTVNERYIRNDVMDFQMSSGMMRVLYILCFLKYVKYGLKYSLLLIDDLGEGLDYNRAKLLGKKVFEDCDCEQLQLIASSNDSFMMDMVDISNWQIVRRKNSKLTVLNKTNTPELFKRFRITGLSNFDLFSSDFIENFLVPSAE